MRRPLHAGLTCDALRSMLSGPDVASTVRRSKRWRYLTAITTNKTERRFVHRSVEQILAKDRSISRS